MSYLLDGLSIGRNNELDESHFTESALKSLSNLSCMASDCSTVAGLLKEGNIAELELVQSLTQTAHFLSSFSQELMTLLEQERDCKFVMCVIE